MTVEIEKKKEDWMNTKWRPMMGWMYMVVCMADFVLFPVLWSLIQALHGGRVETQWNPITLQGAGLFHMAMGAIIGVTAFGRTQEKLQGANNGGATTTASGFQAGAATSSIPSSGFSSATGSTNTPATTSFTPPATWGSTPITTVGGKKVVPDTPQPEL